jgi:O-antigen ligase
MKRKYLSLLIVLIAASNVIGPMPSAGALYPISMGILLVVYSFIGEKLTIDFSMLSIIIVAIFSIFINNPPSYFHSWERLGLFIIIVGVVSPLIQNKRFNHLRMQMFDCLLKLSIVITVLSFVCYFAGINYATTTIYDTETKSFFGGIIVHPMILGPIAAISMNYTFYLVMNNQLLKKYKILLSILSSISFLTALLAASRGAVVAGIAGFMFILYKEQRKAIGRLGRNIVMLFILLSVSYPMWDSLTINIIEKQQGNISSGNMYKSRESKWEARFKEFQSSPIFGVGFATVSEDSGDEFNKITVIIEPGSSWLAVLSMLGILGFIPVVYLFASNLYAMYKDNNSYSALLGSILLFFMVHMVIDGHIFAGGAFLFMFLWLTLGVIVVYRNAFMANRKTF